jgi:hypothetical protein
METMDWEKVYKDLTRRNWIILLILSALSACFLKQTITTGIILGGVVIILNFDALQYTMKRVFPGTGVIKGNKAVLIIKIYFRLLILGGIIFFLVKQEAWVHPVGLAIGFATVSFSIVSFGIKQALRMRITEAT